MVLLLTVYRLSNEEEKLYLKKTFSIILTIEFIAKMI